MTTSSAGAIVVLSIFGLVAALLALFGYLIRGRGIVGLLAGYDPEQVDDPEGLARFAGTLCYQMALGTLLVPILGVFVFRTSAGWSLVGVGYLAFILAICIRLVVGARSFMR